MVEERVWRVENEGNLARTWEQRLKPKEEPRVHRVRRRRWAPWIKPAAWIGGLWAGAVVATFLATQVMTMSYHYDQLNNQYAALTRQNQSLQSTLASMTTAQAMAADAARLKVSMVQPDSVPVAVSGSTHHHVVRAAAPRSTMGQITTWIQNLSQTLAR